MTLQIINLIDRAYPGTKTLNVDLDNTMRDLIGAVIAAAKREFGVTLHRSLFDVWDAPLGATVGISNEDFNRFAWDNVDIQDSSLPFPGAVEAMRALRGHYETVRIVTANQYPDHVIRWLDRYGIEYDDLVFDQDKSGLTSPLVDDSPTTLRKIQKPVRFSQPWNSAEDLAALPTVFEWTVYQGLFVPAKV